MRLFRERLLARLVEKHAISQELASKLMAWRHPSFSAHVGEPIAADDTQALENLAGYVTRNPMSLQRLVYLDARGSNTIRLSDGTSKRWTRSNGWREWQITSRTRGDIARSSTATMPIECAEIAPLRSRERASSKRSQPRSAAVPRARRRQAARHRGLDRDGW